MEKILLFGVIAHYIISGCKKFYNQSPIEEKDINVSAKLLTLMKFKDYALTPMIFLSLIYHFDNPVFIFPDIFWKWCFISVVLLTTCSIALKIWAYKECNNNWSSDLKIYKGHNLITNGPYKYVRHPIYVSYLLFVLACLFSGNPLVIILTTLFFLINIKRANDEDKLLKKEFGHEYVKYYNNTGGFIPAGIQPVLCMSAFYIWCMLSITGVIFELAWLTGHF